jgi:hypothetical protein
MGMSNSSVAKRKPAYDPARQWGLKPEPDAGSSTYVVSGHIVNGSGADPRSIYTTENLGREGQAKAKRKLSGKDADKALKGLLERDKEGMKAVIKAREAGRMMIAEREESGKKDQIGKGGGERKRREDRRRVKDMEGKTPASCSVLASKNAYSAEVIKNLGFDPIARAGQRRGTDSDMKNKVRFFFQKQIFLFLKMEQCSWMPWRLYNRLVKGWPLDLGPVRKSAQVLFHLSKIRKCFLPTLVLVLVRRMRALTTRTKYLVLPSELLISGDASMIDLDD